MKDRSLLRIGAASQSSITKPSLRAHWHAHTRVTPTSVRSPAAHTHVQLSVLYLLFLFELTVLNKSSPIKTYSTEYK